jgi:hypothetical protein
MPPDEIFGLRRKLLENSYISVAKSKTGDNGQLPTGWQLLTYWHFTRGKFTYRTKRRAAVVSANTELGGERLRGSCAKAKRYSVCVPEDVGDTEYG